MTLDKPINYLSLLEKMLTAFFRISRSSLISYNSFFKSFNSSSSLLSGFLNNGLYFPSRCSFSHLFILSELIPNSLATSDRLPLWRLSSTALILYSWLYMVFHLFIFLFLFFGAFYFCTLKGMNSSSLNMRAIKICPLLFLEFQIGEIL